MLRTRVGYTGGSRKNPTYQQLGDHTEALQIDYDPQVITYEQLLAIFWKSHTPTSPPWSQQYKAAIYYHNEAQKQAALQTKEAEAKKRGKTITTEVLSAHTFYRAEDYHQKYRLRRVRELVEEVRGLYSNELAFVDSTAAARLNGYIGGHGTLDQFTQELPKMGLSEKGQRLLQGYTSFSKKLRAR